MSTKCSDGNESCIAWGNDVVVKAESNPDFTNFWSTFLDKTKTVQDVVKVYEGMKPENKEGISLGLLLLVREEKVGNNKVFSNLSLKEEKLSVNNYTYPILGTLFFIVSMCVVFFFWFKSKNV